MHSWILLSVEALRVLANQLYLHVGQGAEIGSLTLMPRVR